MHSGEKRGKVGKSGVISYFPFLASSAVSCAALHIPYFGHNWGKKGRDASRMGSWEWEEAKIQQTEEGENRNLGMRQKLFVGNFPPFFRGEFRLEFTFFYRLNLLSLGNLWPKAEDFLVGKIPTICRSDHSCKTCCFGTCVQLWKLEA